MRYPGGKRKLKSYLDPYFQNKKFYIDPFAGGLALPTMLKFQKYFLNDINPGIASILKCCELSEERLLDLILNWEPAIDKFYEAKETLLNAAGTSIDENYVELAFDKILIHQISYSGLGEKAGSPIGGHSQRSQYPFSCRWAPKKLVKDLENLYKKEISSGYTDYQSYLSELEGFIKSFRDECVIYLDPPYFYQGDALYSQSFTSGEHHDFGSWCLSLIGLGATVVVSYDLNPVHETLIKGFSTQEVMNTSSIHGKRSENTKKHEMIYVANYHQFE